MAYQYSTAIEAGKGTAYPSYGNASIFVNIYRGECTRTETSVSFSFGVSFMDDVNSTWHSLAAYYPAGGGTRRYARVSGQSAEAYVVKNRIYHASPDLSYYWNCPEKHNTTETLVYTYTNNNISATTAKVSVTIGVGWADYIADEKGSLTFSLPIPEFYGGLKDKGSIEIKDNFNNSFTIKATKGAAGTNNSSSLQSGSLKYGYSASTRSTGYTNGATNYLSISGSSKYRKVYAEATTVSKTTPTSGSASLTATKEFDIRQYVGPKDPTSLRLKFNKSRLTLRENWTLQWTAPGLNNECPIKGYRIRLYRKRNGSTTSITRLRLYNKSGSVISTTNSAGDIYYDSNSTATTFTVYPEKYGADIKVGDEISFSVVAYTKYGENFDVGDPVFREGVGESFYYSDADTSYTTNANNRKWVKVRNAGVVNVKKDKTGDWTEGQVYVRVLENGTATWKEAEVVQAYTSSGWKESQ